ncbi:MAG: hypothetical protein ACQERN_13285 [Thermodesulfobacteriota bacterium]
MNSGIRETQTKQKKQIVPVVMPAEAGIQGFSVRQENWMPASAGMTDEATPFLGYPQTFPKPLFLAMNK